MARPTLLVRPGSPDTPEFVDIDCSEMDDTKTIELLINGIVRASIPVELSGGAVLSYIVPAGQIRNALADLNSCHATFNSPGPLLCGLRTGLGDSMVLRYQV